MKKLVLAILFTLPFQILLAQNVKVIPASMSSTAKKEAADEYNPASPQVKPETTTTTTTTTKDKKVKCVPGCSGKKQCVKKASAKSSPPPAGTQAKASERIKK